MNYQQKLTDPRWQKRRLEILDKQFWQCQICGNQENVDVHNNYHLPGDPWAVPDAALVTLCDNCQAEVRRYKWTEQQLIRQLYDMGARHVLQVNQLLVYLEKSNLDYNELLALLARPANQEIRMA